MQKVKIDSEAFSQCEKIVGEQSDQVVAVAKSLTDDLTALGTVAGAATLAASLRKAATTIRTELEAARWLLDQIGRSLITQYDSTVVAENTNLGTVRKIDA